MLESAGVDFRPVDPCVDEAIIREGSVDQVTVGRAVLKAMGVLTRISPGSIVLAADTLVEMNGRQYGKPVNRTDARNMLRELSGCRHQVISAVVLIEKEGHRLQRSVTTDVVFRELDESKIKSYLDSGEASDKAGSYGVQGRGIELVREIRGDLTCVIGFPLSCIRQMYGDLTGVDLFQGQSLRRITFLAFPNLQQLPPQFLQGVPD